MNLNNYLFLAPLIILLLGGCKPNKTNINQLTSSEIEQADYFYNIGVNLANEGKYEAAIKEYDKALEIDSNFGYAYSNRSFRKTYSIY